MWKWINNLASAFTLVQIVVSAILGAAAMTVAFLREFDPLLIFLVGLFVFAMLLYIAERISAWRDRKEKKGNPSVIPKQEQRRWKDWRPDDQFRAKLKSLCGEYSNVEITYYHGPDFKFSRRIASELEWAGWDVNFNKHAYPQGSPIYHGITIQGPLTTLVEGVESALQESGIQGVRGVETLFNTPKGHHKYELGRNRINIFIGYEE